MALNIIDLRNIDLLPTYGVQKIPIIGAVGDDSSGTLRFVIGANSNTAVPVSIIDSNGTLDDSLFLYDRVQNTFGFNKNISYASPDDRLIKQPDPAGQEVVFSSAKDNVYLLKIRWTDQTLREQLVAVVVRPEYRDFYDYFDSNTFRGISNNLFRGSDVADTVLPTGDSDYIFGLGGVDWLEGGGGNDTIDGGSGDDILVGGSGSDSVFGGDGNDLLGGGSGVDRIEGGNGDDVYSLGHPEDTYFDINGEDTLFFDTRSVNVSDDRFDAINLYSQKIPSSVPNYYDLEIIYRYIYAGTSYSVSAKVQQMYIAVNSSSQSPFAIEKILDLAAVDNLYFSVNGLEGTNQPNFIVGTKSDDTLFGYAGSDYLDGGEGQDQLDGGNGNDILNTGPGNDVLSGGEGIDTAAYSGRYSSYILTRSETVWSSSDVRSSGTQGLTYGDGIDTLIGVERLRFLDKWIGVDLDGNAGQAYRVYKAAFNRDPMQGDTKGLGYWIAQIDKGMDLIEVSARFVDSAEFRTFYGNNPTNEQFLTKLYTNVLGRQPEASGFNWWLNELNTNPEKTKAKVLADFAESAENQTGVVSLIGNGITYEPWIG